MTDLHKFLNECASITHKNYSKNAFSFNGENKNVKLSGKCRGTVLEAKLVSKSGALLYSINEDCLKEEYVLSRIKDMTKMFEQAALIEMTKKDDLDREKDDEDKELLLDDADDVEEIALNSDTNNLETDKSDINSLSELKDELIDLATRAQSLVNIFPEEDVINRSMIIGLISGIYEIAQDTIELEEDLLDLEEQESVKESLCVPAKIDYIDLAGKGLSQACYALGKTDNFVNLVGMLKDIKSELAASK